MRSIRIRVKEPLGEVVVSAPVRISEKYIYDFVQSKSDWIKKQQDYIEQLPKPDVIDRARCKQIMLKHVPELLDKWSKALNVEYSGWKTRFMKTRWGSCNIRTRNINLNVALGHYPIKLLDYVVLHELAHLIEKHHNSNFYAILKHHMPDYVQREKDLKQARYL
ncbi:M48 family metallopeptidase [Lysobacter sp. N42]|uniref:M48 family metallopeptidase n=2 Tax=Gammaproteobacteria TaxID=1236 RepID=UPI000DD097D5|nr:SprT family zinc-dependent metalloprotease [Lysobacter sp. N42]